MEWQRQRFAALLPDRAPGALHYEAVSTLGLAPGTYEVRVAMRHVRSGLTGSVHTYVDVPNFNKQNLRTRFEAVSVKTGHPCAVIRFSAAW